MASPFTVFRKNQKVFLAVTAILAMIAFVFLGTCVQSSGPVQAYSNPTVVSWNFGDINQIEMSDRLAMRRILNRFILEAVALSGQRTDMQPVFPETEQDIVRSMVLARRGRELGLVITDEMVNRTLSQLTNNRVRPSDFERITAGFKLQGGQRITAKQMFDALREELLARNVAMLFLDGLGVSAQDPALDPPAQRWDYFRRFKRKVTAQVLPVPVAEFTEEVKKPSERELQELYEKHKDQFPSLNSPDPGFRQSYRARFQFFKANVDELATAQMDSVTDEQIREYYEKNKDTQFRASKLSPIDDEDAKEPAAKDSGKADGQDGKETDAKKEPDESPDVKKDDVKKESEDAPEAKKEAEPADSKADDSKTSLDTKDANTESKDVDQSKGKSSQGASGSPFRFVNFQEDKVKQTPAKNEKSAEAADAKKSDDSTRENAEGKDTAKADAVKVTADKAGVAESAAAKTDSAKEETTQKDDGKEEAKTEPLEHRPLEKVRDEIRRTLARERAQAEIDKHLADLRIVMSRYADQRTRWQIQAAKNPDARKPDPLDTEALAEQHGLKAFNTELLSALEVEADPDLGIGKSRDLNVRSPNFYQPWPYIVFQPKGLYRPLTTIDAEGNSYLSWKIEEREGHIPDFKEARDDVLEAYKRDKARDLAKRQAEKYAKAVRDAREPMKNVFAQDKNLPVKEVGPFAWLTLPNVPFGQQQSQAPQISQVPGVETPGEEFMRVTFNLEAGEIGVAFNHPKSVVYVIQAMDFDPREAVLEQEFMVLMQNYDRYRAAGFGDIIRAQSDWMESLLEEYGVVWHRTADEEEMDLE